MKDCTHPTVSSINPYELIRKYRCDSCDEVMMCSCEAEFARRFLPHQLKEGVELDTQRRIPVTIGFQSSICNSCRGLPEEPHQIGEIYGRSSKLLRYYWREIFFETTKRFGNWAEGQGYDDYDIARSQHNDVYAEIEKEIIEEIKELHSRAPKYTYQEKSQSEVLEENQVEVVRLNGTYVQVPERRVGILDGGSTYSADEFAGIHYEQQGYEVLFTESVPFHAMFGIFMWLLIQDQGDQLVRIVSFGDRTAFEEGKESKEVWTHLPADFGTLGYAIRRASAIEKHFALIPQEKDELIWTFDYWVDPSEGLRQYLWAHRDQDVQKARKIITILPVDVTHRILRYMLGDYWGRYVGWPDIIVHKDNNFFFAEVKSSQDKLRLDQKNWIYGNTSHLHLPFKLIKIHKKSS